MPRSVNLVEGFRATGEPHGVRIEVTDYHAKSVLLTYELIDRLRGGGSLRGARFLILINEQTLHGFFTELLSDSILTMVPSIVEAEALLAVRSYDVVLTTNFGFSNQEALSIVPITRSFPAILISGHKELQIEQECASKRIRCLWAPFSADALRDALDEVLLLQAV